MIRKDKPVKSKGIAKDDLVYKLVDKLVFLVDR